MGTAPGCKNPLMCCIGLEHAFRAGHPLFHDFDGASRFYFLHSYYFDAADMSTWLPLPLALILTGIVSRVKCMKTRPPREKPSFWRTVFKRILGVFNQSTLASFPALRFSCACKNLKIPRLQANLINAVKIFNEKESDELMVLDIDATVNKAEFNYALIAVMRGAVCRLCYGGGITTPQQAARIIGLGVEKGVSECCGAGQACAAHRNSGCNWQDPGVASTAQFFLADHPLTGGYPVIGANALTTSTVRGRSPSVRRCASTPYARSPRPSSGPAKPHESSIANRGEIAVRIVRAQR